MIVRRLKNRLKVVSVPSLCARLPDGAGTYPVRRLLRYNYQNTPQTAMKFPTDFITCDRLSVLWSLCSRATR